MVPLAGSTPEPSPQPSSSSHQRKASGAHELKRKGSRILSNMRKSGSAALLGKAANGVDESDGWTEQEANAGRQAPRSRKNSVNVNVHIYKEDDQGQDRGQPTEDPGIGKPFNVSPSRSRCPCVQALVSDEPLDQY